MTYNYFHIICAIQCPYILVNGQFQQKLVSFCLKTVNYVANRYVLNVNVEFFECVETLEEILLYQNIGKPAYQFAVQMLYRQYFKAHQLHDLFDDLRLI